jgi:hypothetical protein
VSVSDGENAVSKSAPGRNLACPPDGSARRLAGRCHTRTGLADTLSRHRRIGSCNVNGLVVAVPPSMTPRMPLKGAMVAINW